MTVESINSIELNPVYKAIRGDSKAPTFLLTYRGTYIGLMQNCGFSEQDAKSIEANYHELYKVSDQWVEAQLQKASQTGYVDLAFGLRLRTPVLSQCVLGNKRTPYEAQAESRTAGNALGQSYGLLNNRACTEFMNKVRASNYRLSIKPTAHIHDAQYYLIKDDLATLAWTNKHLVKAVQWQDLPAIQHDVVKLGGDLSIFYPTWKDEIVIPNGANEQDIHHICIQEHTRRNTE